MSKKQIIIPINPVKTDKPGVFVHEVKPLYSDEDLINVNIKDIIEDEELRFKDYDDEFTTEFRIPEPEPHIDDEEVSDYVRNVAIAHDTVIIDLNEKPKKPSYWRRVLGALKRLIPSKRRLIQLYAALLFNANIKGYIQGNMYEGTDKFFCSPGINCYSCPGATGACPLGSLQNSIGNHKYSFYILGIILLYGLMFGRMICGWLCPFGLVQDLLYKIKTPKMPKNPVTRALSYLKYVILVLFVFVFAVIGFYPAFCKFICPAGILEAAFGILPQDTSWLESLGALFTWKFTLFICFVVISVFVYRAFCRFICPMGAIYSLFNRFSFFGIKLEKPKCTNCGRCISTCKMDIRHVGDHECISCGDCVDVCPTKAISFKGSKIFLAPSEIDVPDDATDEEIEIVQKHNSKKKKKVKIAKIVIGSVMALILAGSLIYYNFLSTDVSQKLWGWAEKIPLVQLFSDKSTDTDTDTNTETETEPDIETETDTETDSATESDTETEEFIKPPVGNKIGYTCPSASLQVFDKNGFTGEALDPTTTGKVTVINFWYTTCVSCVAELPYFDEIATKYKGSVEVVAVHSTDTSFSGAFDFIKTNYPNSNITFLKDIAGSNRDEYYMALGGSKFGLYPMTVIIDEHGVITFSKRGSLERQDLIDAVKSALEK